MNRYTFSILLLSFILLSRPLLGNESDLPQAAPGGGCSPLTVNEALSIMEKILKRNDCKWLPEAQKVTAIQLNNLLKSRDEALLACVQEAFEDYSGIVNIELEIFWDEEWGDFKSLSVWQNRGVKGSQTTPLAGSNSKIHKCVLNILLAEETYGSLSLNHRLSCESNRLRIPYTLNK